jgi:hypothetical protein
MEREQLTHLDLADVQALIERALHAARAEQPAAANPMALHAGRSHAFVRALADELRDRYHDPDIVSLCKYDDRDQARLGMRELLHDISVCRVAPVESAAQSRTLWYVVDALWQVESELARDSRQALIDFNKLVLGSAHHKLFVGPQVADPEAFLAVLRPAAARCVGQVFAALIPHPDRWDVAGTDVRVWQLHP